MPGCEAEVGVEAGARAKRILIGIPSFRRPEGLRRLLRSLAEQRHVEGVAVEVFVADNDPIGREAGGVCVEVAGSYRWPIRCAVVAEPGISAARNAILDEARERKVDHVAMLDDDEEADSQWLCELLRMQHITGADVVGGPVEYLLETRQTTALRHCGAFRPRPWSAGRVPMIDATGNVLLSCEALQRHGWPKFAPAFGMTGGEDKEFFTRMRLQGSLFAWAPAAIAREHVPAERCADAAVLRRAYRIGNSDLQITRLHEGPAAVLGSAAKSAAVLATVPLTLPVLLIPSRRLWLMRKWARAAGKLAVLTGHSYRAWERRPSSGSA